MSTRPEPPTFDERPPRGGQLFDYHPVGDDDTQDGPATWEEKHAAPEETVKGRRHGSAWLASQSAVLTCAGVDRACDALNKLERERAKRLKGYKPLTFDPNEIRRLCLVVSEAMMAVEVNAEAGGVPCSKLRRGPMPAYKLELHYQRQTIPYDLPKPAREKRVASLGRAWRRRWQKLYLVRCYLHLGLFDVEPGAAGAHGKVSPSATDRFLDLVAATKTLARREGGNLVNRYNRAASEVLAKFREEFPPFAPEWKPDSYVEDSEAAAKTKAAGEAAEPDLREEARRAVRSPAVRCARIARDLGLSGDEEVEFRLELQREFEAAWTSAPEGGGSAGAGGG